MKILDNRKLSTIQFKRALKQIYFAVEKSSIWSDIRYLAKKITGYPAKSVYSATLTINASWLQWKSIHLAAWKRSLISSAVNRLPSKLPTLKSSKRLRFFSYYSSLQASQVVFGTSFGLSTFRAWNIEIQNHNF